MLQVPLQVSHILNAHRQAQQPLGEAERLPLLLGHRGVGHGHRVAHQAFHAPQAFGQGEHLQGPGYLAGVFPNMPIANRCLHPVLRALVTYDKIERIHPLQHGDMAVEIPILIHFP